MKYAELKRRLRAETRRADTATSQATLTLRVLLGNAWTGDCGHLAIRRPMWPCPHPQCSGWSGRVQVRQIASDVSEYSSAPVQPSVPIDVLTLTLARERLWSGTSDVWAWRVAP